MNKPSLLNKYLRLCSLLLSAALVFLLCGCNQAVFNQTESNIADAKQREINSRAQTEATAVKPSPPLLIKEGVYVDTTPVSLQKQPGWLKNPIVIRGDQLPFSYYGRLISAAAGKNVLTKTQTGLDSKMPLSINYSGTVKGALDLLAAKSGYVYNIYRGDSIYWQAFISRTYNIAFMPGNSDYVMGQTSGGSIAGSTGGTGAIGAITDASSQEFSSLKGSLSLWKDIDSTIHQLLSPEGKVFVSQSTTSVTVRDRPTNVDLIGQYIHNLNTNLSQQVFIKIEILDVTLTNDYNMGINWEMLERAFAHSNFILNANYSSPITITPLTGGAIPTVGLAPSNATQALFAAGATTLLSAVISALSQQSKVAIVAQPRVVAMNNQVSAIRVVNQQGYIQSVQNTSVPSSSASGSGSQTVNNVSTITSQITPGTLVTGLTLYILPKIMGDKVYIQVNVDLSQKISIDTLCAQSGTTAGTCAASSFVIQSPNVTEKIFNQRSVLQSGQTLVLSGLKQINNSTGAMQLFNLQELGGESSQQSNDDTVVLITPYILPQTHGAG